MVVTCTWIAHPHAQPSHIPSDLVVVSAGLTDSLQPARPLQALSFLLAVLWYWFVFLSRNLAVTPAYDRLDPL